jgi:glutamine amidotransferase
MSRLVAYLGEPISPAWLVFGGEHSLYRQSRAPRELLSGSMNADGYGVVWYSGGGPRRLAATCPIWHDEQLESTLAGVSSPCVVAALRSEAEPGMPLDRAGLQPLTAGCWTFVFDGGIPAFRKAHMRALRQSLPDELYAELRGSSDSETLFLLALAAVKRGATPAEALESVARAVLARVGKGGDAQLNMLLTNGESLTALRSSTVLLTNSLYVARHSPFAPGGTVIASERLGPGSAWEAVDGHHLLEITQDGSMRAEMVFL